MQGRSDVVAFALAGVVFWAGLGSYGLVEPSDARYAEIAREMWVSGDWLFPRLLGILHFQKPPLIYWLSGLGTAFVGPSEWGARACQGVLGLVLVGLVWRFARRHLGAAAAPWAVALVATTPTVIAAGRILTTDLLLATLQTLALTAWYDVWSGRGGRGDLAAFYAALGAAFLAKGPVGWLVPGLILGLFAWRFRGGGHRRVPWGLVWGSAIMAAVAFPWYLLVIARTPGLFSYFLGGQIASRLQESGMGHHHAWYYFFAVFPALGMPWILLAPSGWKRLRGEDSPLAGFLLFWTAVPPLFFSFPASKLPLYVLLSFPALALAGAASLVAPSEPRRPVRWAGILFLGLGAAFASVGVGAVPMGGGDWAAVSAENMGRLFLPLAVAAAVAGAAAIAWSCAGTAGARRGVAALAVCLTAATGWTFANSDHLPLHSARAIAIAAASEIREGDTLAEYRDLSSGLPFYTGRLPLMVDIKRETQFESRSLADRLISRSDFLRLWKGPGRVLALTSPERALELPQGRELARAGGFLLLANQ
jgi:4-amino-4-deoxy-L-arabinose transferase-like glycosyltransferase